MRKRKKIRVGREEMRPEGPVIIGIASAGHGCGATHFTLLFANYLAAVERQRTAVLEWKEQEALTQLGRICTGTETESPFSILGVDYFPRCGVRELAECIKTHQVILMDFGSLEEEDAALFFQCSVHCLLAALNEWKLGELLRRREWILQGRKRWNYLMASGSEEARRELARRYGLTFRRIPFSPDVFSINRETAAFLARIWAGGR